jgi:hypothetical protein
MQDMQRGSTPNILVGLQNLVRRTDNNFDHRGIAFIEGALSERLEFKPSFFEGKYFSSEYILLRLLAEIHDARFMPYVPEDIDDIPSRVITESLQSLTIESIEHNRLMGIAPSLEISLDGSISVIVGYDIANGEGIGGVYIYLQDANSGYPIPAFIVRGNPTKTKEGMKEFAIRAVQPWASEGITSIVNLQRGIEEKQNQIIRRGLDEKGTKTETYQYTEKIVEILNQRKRLIDRLRRRLKLSGETNKDIYTLIVAISCIYLQGLGIQQFRGITHDMVPEVIAFGSDLGGFNYDDFWSSCQFRSEYTDYIHGWLKTGNITLESLGMVSNPKVENLINSLRSSVEIINT